MSGKKMNGKFTFNEKEGSLVCIEAGSNLLSTVKELEKQIHDKKPCLINIEKLKFSSDFPHDIFLNLFSRFSTIERVDAGENFSLKNQISDSCKKNLAIKNFAKEVSSEIKSLNDRHQDTMMDAFRIGKLYTKFWDLSQENYIIIKDFLNLLDDECSEEDKNFFEQCEKFHLLNIITNDFTIEKASEYYEIISLYSKKERNAIFYKYSYSPCRIIDSIDDPSIVGFLVNSFDFDPLTDSQVIKINDNRYSQTKNILMRSNLDEDNIKLINNISDRNTFILDALAFSLESNRYKKFKKILSCYRIVNFNEPLKKGRYKDYTITQLYLLLHSDNKINKFPDKFFTNETLKDSFASFFPRREKELSEIQVIKYLIYKKPFTFYEPQICFLKTNWSEREEKKENCDMNNEIMHLSLIESFLKGLVDHQKYRKNDDRSKNDCNDVMGKIEVIIKILTTENIFQVNNIIIPYLIKNNESSETDKAIALLFKHCFKNKSLFSDETHKDLTILQLLVLYGRDKYLKKTYESIKLIAKKKGFDEILRKNLLLPFESKKQLKGYDKFSLINLAIYRDMSNFIKIFSEEKVFENILNEKFSPDHDLYPDWNTVHFSIFLFKIEKISASLLFFLLTKFSFDSSICFPNNSCYLEGLNILQSIIVEKDNFYKENNDRRKPDSHLNLENDIQSLIEKLDEKTINFICQYKKSPYYGKTALFLAIEYNKIDFVKSLLSTEKTDYTIKNYENSCAKTVARYFISNKAISLIEKAEKKFPKHIEDLQKGLKYTSDVNPNFKISIDKWLLSILREKNSDHTFLVIEGIEHDEKEKKIRPMARLSHLLRRKNGKMNIESVIVYSGINDGWLSYSEHKEENLLEKLSKQASLVSLITTGQQFFPESCFVEKNQLEELWREIEAEKEEVDRRNYNLFGDLSFFNRSSSSKGENCVSWAKKKYNKVAPKNGQLPEDVSRYIISHARFFLNERFHYIRQNDRYGLEEKLDHTMLLVNQLRNDKRTADKNQHIAFSGITSVITYTVLKDYLLTNSTCSLGISAITGVFAFYAFEYFSSNERHVSEPIKKSL